jgi:anthranilate phosphoribosyltransferase
MTATHAETVAVGSAINRVLAGDVLTRAETAEAFLAILEAAFEGADVAWGALLGALHARGPTLGEVRGLVDAVLRFDPELADQLAAPIDLGVEARVVAIAGSGKETFKTFNVSTAAAFVAAAHPDVCVVKPAGRATSAVTGASDLLAELDVRPARALGDLAEVARGSGVCVFDYHLVAPRYGPRYEGRFHHLHPLSYVTPWMFVPIQTDGVVFGVADSRVELTASVMALSGVERAAVVSTAMPPWGRIDELAPFGKAELAIVCRGAVERQTFVAPVPSDLSSIAQRPTSQANAELFLDVLSGRAPKLALELVQENAAVVLHVAGVVDDLDSGRATARALLASGAALAQLDVCRQASQEM